MNNIRSGKVAFYNPRKGYGYITPSDGGKDIFFHISNGVHLRVEKGEIVFSNQNIYDLYRIHNIQDPRKGDKIVFMDAVGKKNLRKCSPWCYQFMFDHVKECLSHVDKSDLENQNLSEGIFNSSCFICGEISFFYGQVYPGCDCFDELENDNQEYPEDDPDEEVYRHEVRLSDSPMGTVIFE